MFNSDQEIFEKFPFADLDNLASQTPDPFIVILTLLIGLGSFIVVFKLTLDILRHEKVKIFLYLSCLILLFICVFYQFYSWGKVQKIGEHTQAAEELISQDIKTKYKINSVVFIENEEFKGGSLSNGVNYNYYILGLEDGQVLNNQLVSRNTKTGEPFINLGGTQESDIIR